MSKEPTSSSERDRLGMTPEDWKRLDALTDDEINAAALTDPDNPPLTAEQLGQFRRPALARRVRLKLRLGAESFSAAYGIPLETLRAWERHEAEPTATEMAYLRLIERTPELARLVPAET